MVKILWPKTPIVIKFIAKNSNGQPCHIQRFRLPNMLVSKNPMAKCVIAINVYVQIGKRPKIQWPKKPVPNIQMATDVWPKFPVAKYAMV